MTTAYDILGVPRNASNETIRTAFRTAAKACHPDLNVGDPTAELQIRVVITAYEILKNAHKRAAYDRLFRERRRERTRHFGMATAANLLRACIVALTVSASISQSSTHEGSAPSSPENVSATIRVDGSRQTTASEDKAEIARPELIAVVNAVAPPSSNSVMRPALGERAAKSVSPHVESGSVVGREESHNRAIKVAAHQHGNEGRITTGESSSRHQRRIKSNRRMSTGARDQFILPHGPSKLVAFVVSKLAPPKTSSAAHARVGAGGRVASYKTRQITVSSRAEAAAEKAYRLHRIPNTFRG
jgi:curved DNA-binding protein CbpA